MSLLGTEEFSGEIILHDISLQQNIVKYRHSVDLVSGDDRLNSSLSVIDYIVFFCMVSGNYDENTMWKINRVLKELGLFKIKKESMNKLPKEKQIKIRCIAAYLKEVKLLICDDIMKDISADERQNIYLLLKNYFVKRECVCLLISNDSDSIKKFTNQILFL